jgi:hypothetical protein
MYYRKQQESRPQSKKINRVIRYNRCKKCGQPSQAQTGHRRACGRVFCPSTETKSFEEWKAETERQFKK